MEWGAQQRWPWGWGGAGDFVVGAMNLRQLIKPSGCSGYGAEITLCQETVAEKRYPAP